MGMKDQILINHPLNGHTPVDIKSTVLVLAMHFAIFCMVAVPLATGSYGPQSRNELTA